MSLKRALSRCVFALCLWSAAPATAQDSWVVDHTESTLAFLVNIGGAEARGAFDAWEAEIHFDPTMPEAGQVAVTVAMPSVTIDNAQARAALAQAAWLATEVHPAATFEAAGFDMQDADRFSLTGTLRLKGVEMPLTLSGTLTIDGDHAEANVTTSIARLDHGVGTADPSVGLAVAIEVRLLAHRSGQ